MNDRKPMNTCFPWYLSKHLTFRVLCWGRELFSSNETYTISKYEVWLIDWLNAYIFFSKVRKGWFLKMLWHTCSENDTNMLKRNIIWLIQPLWEFPVVSPSLVVKLADKKDLHFHRPFSQFPQSNCNFDDGLSPGSIRFCDGARKMIYGIRKVYLTKGKKI